MKKTKRYLLENLQRAYDALYYDEDRYAHWEFGGEYDVNEHNPMLKTKTEHRLVFRKNPEIRAVVEYDIRGQERCFRIFTPSYDPLVNWALRKIDRHL